MAAGLMRRVLTFILVAALVVASLGIGAFTADLPFWQRAFQLPLAPDEGYLPVATIGLAEPAPLEPVAAEASGFDAAAVESAASRARNAGSRALLVMHRGRLEIERYFAADDARSLVPAGLIAKPLAAMAVGQAIADGRIRSLDAPVAEYLAEWKGEPRGRITVRQLLDETSGLETGGDIAGILRRSPWDDLARLPAFATSKGARMLLGNDFESSALGFALDHETGAFHNVSPANTQLAALIVERATGVPYEKFLDQLWRRAGAGTAQLQLDRRSGMPAAHCCWRASARDVLRIASLLAAQGEFQDRAVVPASWIEEMARPARVNPETALQLARTSLDGLEVLGASDDSGSSFWVIRERGLTIVNIAGSGGGSLPELPALLLAALKTGGAKAD
jgi:CubicO group peptidase (beta-lactamase class C family)